MLGTRVPMGIDRRLLFDSMPIHVNNTVWCKRISPDGELPDFDPQIQVSFDKHTSERRATPDSTETCAEYTGLGTIQWAPHPLSSPTRLRRLLQPGSAPPPLPSGAAARWPPPLADGSGCCCRWALCAAAVMLSAA
jgi:hypothetical protein